MCPRWLFALVLVMPVLLGITLIGGLFLANRQPEFYPYQVTDHKLIHDWLESQRKGLSGSEYWKENREPVTFSQLESYETVEHPTRENFRRDYIVRVHCHAQASPPTANLWKVEVLGHKIWGATPVEYRDGFYYTAFP